MLLTQTKVTAAFDHVLKAVFGVPKDGPLYKALVTLILGIQFCLMKLTLIHWHMTRAALKQMFPF